MEQIASQIVCSVVNIFTGHIVKDMRKKMFELGFRSIGIKNHKKNNKRIPARVEGWLGEVENVKNEVESILINGIGCLDMKKRYQAGRTAFKTIKEIERLLNEEKHIRRSCEDINWRDADINWRDTAAISTLVKNVSGRLTSGSIQEFGLPWGLEILTFKPKFDQIEVVLQDAEEKSSRDTDVDLWLVSLRSTSLEIEKLLNEISAEAKLRCLNKKRGIKYRVRAFFSSEHNQLMFRIRIAHRLEATRTKLDAIASRISELCLTPSDAGNHVNIAARIPPRPITTAYIDKSFILGRDFEIEEMKSVICSTDLGKYGNDDIRVYGIWGMAGVGKTTLARLFYNHPEVTANFDYKCWVCVGKDFQVHDIIEVIIASVAGSPCRHTDLDVLLEYLHNKLKGRKFLIVLDDVWIEEDEMTKWDLLSKTLSCGREGSFVVMTTRSQKTCQMMAKVPKLQLNLECLSIEDSLALFMSHASGDREEGDIERIGKEIVMKCEGLPLALESMGRLFRVRCNWLLVNKRSIFELGGDKLLNALKFSYNELTSRLKQCFAYCCLFPIDYEMEKDMVIQLWVASGCIPPHEGRDLYELGHEIFDDLVSRSFFKVVKKKEYSKVRFKVCGLMHETALIVMRDDFLFIEFNNPVVIHKDVLHLSSSWTEYLFSTSDLGKLTSIKSVFLFRHEYYTCNISQIFNHVNLSVLYLSGIRLWTLPDSISNLKYLKYLNLSYSSLEVLPESIIYLQNLQVLLLNFCSQLHKLPEGLGYMSDLRILDISSCDSLLHLPCGIRELTKLQRLPHFPVGNKSGAKIEELDKLNLLEGEMEITALENVESICEAWFADLKSKEKQSVLKLSWSKIYRRENKEKMVAAEDVLEGLQPNPSLKELRISFFPGKVISPRWMVKLENLEEIAFSGCKQCESIPSVGKLPNLRVIKLLGMDSLKSFDVEDKTENTNMFLGVQELNIFMCPKLVSLPHNLPQLNILNLEECGALELLPVESFKGLKTLEIYGCKYLTSRYGKDEGVDWPKISHIPDIRIDSPRFTSEL